jgi:hypothetical protein
MTSLVQLEPFVNHCTSIFRARLDEFANSGQVIDVSHWLQCYAFDVIGKITVRGFFGCVLDVNLTKHQLGQRFGFLDSGEDIQGIMNSLVKSLAFAARVGIYPVFHPVLFYLNAILLPNMKGMVYTMRFIETFVLDRLKKPLPKKDDSETAVDFITKFLHIQAENPQKMSNSDIMISSMSNIGAGSDTTGVSLTSVIYYLSKHPDVLSLLRQEIDGWRRQSGITEPITFNQAQQLPYLQAVIKEALRVHPATGLTLGRVVPSGGYTIAGQFFPAGVGFSFH